MSYRGQLPPELRRNRGKPVAAHRPEFWPFGPPAPGKGPKPIRYGQSENSTEPDDGHDGGAA